MSIGISVATAVIVPASKQLSIAGDNYFRHAVTVNLSGHNTATALLALFAYRNSILEATQAAAGWTGSASAASTTVDLNTTAMQTLFTGITKEAVRELNVRIYNSTSLELIGQGNWAIRSPSYDYATDMGSTPVVPITGSTLKWGKLAMTGGITYGLNDDDGLYYPVSFHGAGAAIHLDLGETGIVIP